MRRTVHCIHYRGMLDHSTCEAGVEFAKFQGLPFEQRPCFLLSGKPPCPGCDKQQFPTAEELAAEEAAMVKRFENISQARAAIVAYLGGSWKRGTPGASGQIDCPVCQGKYSLRFSRSGYNGHIHAACKTDRCVRWME